MVGTPEAGWGRGWQVVAGNLEPAAYLPGGGSRELEAPQHHAQQRQELFVLVLKAVPEDNGADDIGDCTAQVEGGINERACRVWEGGNGGEMGLP